jgi:flap endonuclease-1
MVENGVKPIYVFDGKPPELKSGVVSFLFAHTYICWAISQDSSTEIFTARFPSLLNVLKSETKLGKRLKKPKRLVPGHSFMGQGRHSISDANVVLSGTVEDMDRQARRQVRVTKDHKIEVQRLLKLMGIPYHDVSALAFPLALSVVVLLLTCSLLPLLTGTVRG